MVKSNWTRLPFLLRRLNFDIKREIILSARGNAGDKSALTAGAIHCRNVSAAIFGPRRVCWSFPGIWSRAIKSYHVFGDDDGLLRGEVSVVIQVERCPTDLRIVEVY